jgi:uncharacterized protein with NAD-binding domain and iron-sulfur cluster
MAKKKLAILGGGIAGLTTAYQLTKTPELRAAHDVTIYQMGWRVGGKTASGRVVSDTITFPKSLVGRNVEHGLHIWFGHYENAFRMLQEVYALRGPDPMSYFQTWQDAFKPRNWDSIGIKMPDGWTCVPVEWATKSGYPGDGTYASMAWGAFTDFLEILRDLLGHYEARLASGVTRLGPDLLDKALFLFAVRAGHNPTSTAQGEAERIANAPELTLADVLQAAHLWASALGLDHTRHGPSHPQAILSLTGAVAKSLQGEPAAEDPVTALVVEAIHISNAVMHGWWADLLEPDLPFNTLDGIEFSDWLIRHGADPAIVRSSSIVRQVYDTSFQYEDGDPLRRNYAAGTALGCFMSLMTQYKGSIMYMVQGGFGEAVIAPIYEALLDAGVKFKFFRKVSGLELSQDKASIARVRLQIQAEPIGGDYRATITYIADNGKRMTVWPAEPIWDRLKNGDALKQAKVDFESNWCTEPPVGTETLIAGTDFDTIVLAISMGAYKPFGSNRGFCAELVAQHGPFADFVNNIGLIPSIGVQLWSTRTLAELGGDPLTSPVVAGPEPLDIWADMTQVLNVEPKGPATLHYLCGPYPTTLYRAPPSDPTVPAKAAAEVRQITVAWLNASAYYIWPKADNRVTFDWNALSAPADATGEARLDYQFLRANIDPTECCVASATGTTKYRLYPEGSGFKNLIIAGEAAQSGFNTSSVEGAVMTGMAASRAICGFPKTIANYDLLTRKPSDPP